MIPAWLKQETKLFVQVYFSGKFRSAVVDGVALLFDRC
jgi:hypothetical protein